MWPCPGKGLPVFSEYCSRSQLLTTDKTSLCIWRHAQSVLAQSMPIEVDIIKPSHASLTVTEKPEESMLANALNLSTGPLSLPFPALEAVFSAACALYHQSLGPAGWPCICLYCPIALLCFPGLHVPRDCSAGHGRNPMLGETTNVWILWINSAQCQWRNCGMLLR